jgi:endonuclease/exonuclease/phosphatase family metal-dependent hydrolase
MAFSRTAPVALGLEVWIANLHASAGPARRQAAEREVWLAAERASEWAGSEPLLFGGDLNLRPRDTDLYDRLADELDLRAPTCADSLDHLLVRGLEIAEPADPWAPERREVPEDGLALRLSDHAPVQATFVHGSMSGGPG